MRWAIQGTLAAGAFLALSGCGSASRSAGLQSTSLPASAAQPSRSHSKYTAADVRFMKDMIHHHAQALLIAGWIPTHGANATLRRLGERIVVGQRDEQVLMVNWLKDRNEAAPNIDTSHAVSSGGDHAGHTGSMPGMLSAEQLTRLDKARSTAFDRLFLEFMIIHHRGALVMVDELMESPGAAQDETVFRLASDIQAEQANEIKRMQQMLEALPPETPTP